MTPSLLQDVLEIILDQQKRSGRPLAVFLAGHNGSGKSTMWYTLLADSLQIPLINADRMMLSVLPEVTSEKPLPEWAENIRDKNRDWMEVARNSVEAFREQAMIKKVSFAIETVFSHKKFLENGKFESKIDTIHQLQQKGYFVLLLFVGLSNYALSILRVERRVANKGHDVPIEKLKKRFPNTQEVVRDAIKEADASILVDNSRDLQYAFTLCRVQMKENILFDLRGPVVKDGKEYLKHEIAKEIEDWLKVVCPYTSDLEEIIPYPIEFLSAKCEQ